MKKPSGFKWPNGNRESLFAVKDTRYGCKYWCRHCGKQTLGVYFGQPEKMHWSDCVVLAEKKPPAEKEG